MCTVRWCNIHQEKKTCLLITLEFLNYIWCIILLRYALRGFDCDRWHIEVTSYMTRPNGFEIIYPLSQLMLGFVSHWIHELPGFNWFDWNLSIGGKNDKETQFSNLISTCKWHTPLIHIAHLHYQHPAHGKNSPGLNHNLIENNVYVHIS